MRKRSVVSILVLLVFFRIMKHKMRVIVLLLIAVNLFCGIVNAAMVDSLAKEGLLFENAFTCNT